MLLRRRSMFGAGTLNLDGKLGSLEVGTVITIGSVGDFIVVHQGNPDASVYDGSCNGTWLLLNAAYQSGNYKHVFDNRSSNYNGSSISDWLKSTFDNLFSDLVKPRILSVKLPYYDMDSYKERWLNEGFSCKSFLPSICEFGFDYLEINSKNSGAPHDGAVLGYFKSITNGDLRYPHPKRAIPQTCWYRSPYVDKYISGGYAFCTVNDGHAVSRVVTSQYAIRPMIIMDKYTPIDGDEIAIVE